MSKKRVNNKKNNKKVLIVGVILGIIICLFCIYEFLLLPNISLKGGNSIVVDYKGKYSEKGYKATKLGKDITKDVKVSGSVNTKKLGTYDIKYVVGSGLFKKTKIRKVEVKDREKPKLDINKDDIYVCPGSEYKPEKVKANDNYDGDISKKVKSIISKDKKQVTYQVTDKSGNTKKVIKKIIYKDKDGPVITLEGNEEMYISKGQKFNEPGYKAEDNCDGDLTKNVKVEGSVDSNNTGEYKLTYTVTDKSGNKTTKERKVIVSNGVIYLTFDDGPNSGTTNVILDILKEEGVKATFFVTNNGPDELIKREYDEGHTVALHTASHDYSIVYASVESYFNDLYSVQERVKRITGVESKIIRFPGGASNTISRRYSQGIMSTLTKEVVNRGFKYYDWNLSSGDAAGGKPTANDIYNNVVNSLSHDRVNMVLMHDIKTYTRDALRDIIRYGKNNGYIFEKITMDTEMITQRVNN